LRVLTFFLRAAMDNNKTATWTAPTPDFAPHMCLGDPSKYLVQTAALPAQPPPEEAAAAAAGALERLGAPRDLRAVAQTLGAGAAVVAEVYATLCSEQHHHQQQQQQVQGFYKPASVACMPGQLFSKSTVQDALTQV
jgi:hypothetical protein